MNIKRKIGLMISALGLAGSVYLGVKSESYKQEAEAELRNWDNTGEAKRVIDDKDNKLKEIPQNFLSKRDLGTGGLVGCTFGGLISIMGGAYFLIMDRIENKLRYP